jgi:hypothetical protein
LSFGGNMIDESARLCGGEPRLGINDLNRQRRELEALEDQGEAAFP